MTVDILTTNEFMKILHYSNSNNTTRSNLVVLFVKLSVSLNCSFSDRVLRTRKTKQEKKPLTNAEKCKARRERRKLNAALREFDKAKKKQENQIYYTTLTPDTKCPGNV